VITNDTLMLHHKSQSCHKGYKYYGKLHCLRTYDVTHHALNRVLCCLETVTDIP